MAAKERREALLGRLHGAARPPGARAAAAPTPPRSGRRPPPRRRRGRSAPRGRDAGPRRRRTGRPRRGAPGVESPVQQRERRVELGLSARLRAAPASQSSASAREGNGSGSHDRHARGGHRLRLRCLDSRPRLPRQRRRSGAPRVVSTSTASSRPVGGRAHEVAAVGRARAGSRTRAGRTRRSPAARAAPPWRYSPEWASLARWCSCTGRAYLEGLVGTTGLSISPRRVIRSDHWPGFRTCIAWRPSFRFAPNSGLKPTWMWSAWSAIAIVSARRSRAGR